MDLQFHLPFLNDDTALEVCATNACSNLTAFDEEHILHKLLVKKAINWLSTDEEQVRRNRQNGESG